MKSLSIRISADGLSFCVYAPAEQQRYTYHVYQMNPVISVAANLKQALQNDSLLQADYQRVNVLIATPQYTTVPVVAFDRERIEDVFHFVFPKATQSHISYNVLRRSGIAVIFGLDKNVYQLLRDDFPRARFYASASTLIEYLGEQSLGGAGRKLYVYLHEGFNVVGTQGKYEMEIYCFDQGRMTFVNSYPVNGIDDCQYYALSVWQQMHLDQLADTFCIVDEDDLSRQLAGKIKYFIKHTQLISRTDDQVLHSFGTSAAVSSAPRIPYDLQTLLVCGF